MTTILAAAASGMVYGQNVLDVVGNNLANVNTFGFKKSRAVAEGRPDALATPDTMRMGVADTTQDLIFSAAAPQTTGDPLHFSIQDDTFFRVSDIDGSTAYTRFGALGLDSAGNITAFHGRLLQPPLTLPAGLSNPAIGSNGEITAIDANGAAQAVGQITLVRFTNPQGLLALGDGLYRETVNTGQTTEGTPGSDGFAQVTTGALEGSNVDVAEEFTTMILAQRAYQAAAKTYSVGDEMLSVATNLTR
jgi:flagellar basal-body rod protein FlgG